MKQAILAFGLALILSAVFTALLIPLLKKKHIGQHIREVGPKHQQKAGTPTMGGMAFVPAILFAVIPFLKDHPEIVPVLAMTVGYGLIGLLDDGLKKKHGVNEGLKAWQKFGLQLLMTVAFCWYRMAKAADPTMIRIPFVKEPVDIGFWVIPLFFLLVLGTDNGVNLTDGIDGLCSSVTAVVALFFTAISFLYGSGIEPVTAAVCGALLGFLLFNTNPARIFMGDTGSLALGGFVASSAIILRQPFMLLICGIIYVCETLSVMIQVSYFKITHGKRVFKMTPIHHTFEFYGWSEARIVIVFTVITVFFCCVAYLGA